ncbi:MAG TPA: hypothetical protein VK485_04490 [Sphingomicrobium sp.]|nr:hypothetical protein [Sphingomicrobium sp.]
MKLRITSIVLLALTSACAKSGDIIEGQGVLAVRTACPQVAIPAATGDITLFDPAGRSDAAAIDVSAAMTNVRATCTDDGAFVVSTASFDVVATRRDAGAARQVVLPYFDVAMQGGSTVVAKRVGRVALDFAAGSIRAQTSGQATVRIARASATLPSDVQRQLTRRRKPGDADAAIDPMTDPTVRDAVTRATFEHLVGFQLTTPQLQYNATR